MFFVVLFSRSYCYFHFSSISHCNLRFVVFRIISSPMLKDRLLNFWIFCSLLDAGLFHFLNISILVNSTYLIRFMADSCEFATSSLFSPYCITSMGFKQTFNFLMAFPTFCNGCHRGNETMVFAGKSIILFGGSTICFYVFSLFLS